MKKSTNHFFSNTVRLFLLAVFAITLTFSSGGQSARAASSPAPVNLGAAAPFAVLTKTGISTTGTTAITGNIGVSPAAATYITGFSLIMDGTNRFSRSSLVTGKVYAANYATPTPANMTTAISNMQTAYTNAAGRTLPDFTDLYGGNLSGRTLAPGLYKWNTGVVIYNKVTLSGPADAVWIFQISKNLTLGSGAKVLLSGGAQAKNIFWQVGGGVGVEMGTTSHLEGTILAAKAIHLRTGASLNGRALSQTAVTLDANRIVRPSSTTIVKITKTFTSQPTLDGWVVETGENSNVGGSKNSINSVIRIGDNSANKQMIGILSFNTGSSIPDTAVITKVILKVRRQGVAGLDPVGLLGGFKIDMRRGTFGTPDLTSTDFEAPANSKYGPFNPSLVNNIYQFNLTNGKAWINKLGVSGGLTQMRLRFSLDDNNNAAANYISIFSGNAVAAYRPRLIIEYYVP